MAKMVLGVFNNRTSAEDALITLEDSGYSPKDISIMMRDDRESREFADNTGTNVAGGAISGATTGGVLGALAGLLIGVGIIPGLGAILIGGPLAAALGLTGAAATTVSGAATGAVAGGILGALAGLGVPDEDAKVYEQSIRDGGILLAVPAHLGEEAEVEGILSDYGATQIRSISTRDNYSPRVEQEEGYAAPAYYSEVEPGTRRKTRRRVG